MNSIVLSIVNISGVPETSVTAGGHAGAIGLYVGGPGDYMGGTGDYVGGAGNYGWRC